MIKLAYSSREKKVLVTAILTVLLTVILNLLNLYVSPDILETVEDHASMEKLLFTIVIFVLLIMLVSASLVYVNENALCGRISVRCEIVNLLNKKAATTSYPNMYDDKFQKLLTKSMECTDSNQEATEAVWTTLITLSVNFTCFFIYAGLLTQIQPALILVILTTAGISYFISRSLNGYEYEHREEEAKYVHRMNYLLGRAKDFGAAKDIRIFGLRSWLEELYEKNNRAFTAFHRKAESVYIWARIADAAFAFLRNGAAYIYLVYLVLYQGMDVAEFLLYFTAVDGFPAGFWDFWKHFTLFTDSLLIFPQSGNAWIIRKYFSLKKESRLKGKLEKNILFLWNMFLFAILAQIKRCYRTLILSYVQVKNWL